MKNPIGILIGIVSILVIFITNSSVITTISHARAVIVSCARIFTQRARFKVFKEQIIGLVVALEIFVEEGDSLYERQMKTVRYIARELDGISDIELTIIPNDEKLHEHPFSPHVPRLLIQWDPDALGLTGNDVDEAMAKEDPPIFLRRTKYYNYFTNKIWRQVDPYYLRDNETKIVAKRLKSILKT